MFILCEKSRDGQFDISLKDLIEKRHVQYMICELYGYGIVRRPSALRGSGSWFSVKDDRYHRYRFHGHSSGERLLQEEPITGENMTGVGRPYVPDDQVLMALGGGKTFLTAKEMEESLVRFAEHVRQEAPKTDPYAYTRAYLDALAWPGYWYPETFDRTLERIHVLTFARERYSYYEQEWLPCEDRMYGRSYSIFRPTLVIGKGSKQLKEVLLKLRFAEVDYVLTVAEARRKIVEKPATAKSITERTYPILLFDESVAPEMYTLIQELLVRVSYELSREQDDADGVSDPVASDILLDYQRILYVPSLPDGIEIDEEMLLIIREHLERGLGLF